jgi:hypothetical protein
MKIRDINKLIIAVSVVLLFGTYACQNDTCSPCITPTPPISVLAVEVIDFNIRAFPTLSDPIECQLTLTIENTSAEYSYSDISIPIGTVFLSSNNQLLGEIAFETDWDGVVNAGETVTVVINKIIEDSEIFPEPCGEDVYIDILITTSDYGETKKRTPTDNLECFF